MSSTPNDLTYVGGAADSNGNALLLWNQVTTSTATANQLYAARYDATCNIWRQAVRVDRTNVSPLGVTRPMFDASGNLVVAWTDSGRTGVYASRYVASSDSWEEPVTLQSSTSGIVSFVSMVSASATKGDRMLVWSEEVAPGSSLYSLYVTRYSASTGSWSAPLKLNADSASQPFRLFADANGNAFALWRQQGRTQARRYNTSTGTWEATNDLGQDPVGPTTLAIDYLGNAFLVLPNVNVARYDVRTATWTTTQLDATAGASFPFATTLNSVTVDSKGNAFAPIMRSNKDLYVARYDVASGVWSPPSNLEVTSGQTTSSTLGPAVDTDGNAFMISVRSASSGFDLNASRYNISSKNWITSRLVAAIPGFSSTPMFSLRSGNLLVGWGTSDGSYARTYAMRFNVASDSWNTPSAVDATVGGAARLFNVTQDNNGNGILIGTQFNGAYSDLFAARYDVVSATWTPPTTLDTASDTSATASVNVTDSTGAVYQYWTQPNPDQTKGLYVSRYDPTSKTWSQAVNLAPKMVSIHDYFQNFPDSSNLIVWKDDTSPNGNLFVSIYR